MISTRGWWYDGKTSARREVTVSCGADGFLRAEGEGIAVSAALPGVMIDQRLDTPRRIIRFPDGETFETTDHTFLEQLNRLQGKGGFFRTVHRWESSLKLAFCALLLTLIAGFCFVRYAIPFLSTQAAFALPPETEKVFGTHTLQMLDRLVLKPSKLSEERRRELAAIFASITALHPERTGWTLEFRSGEAVGANAFALPSGIVILTDRLVEIGGSDEELAAVLAHEIAHVDRRHALRHLLQNSATVLLVATLTGDVTSITSLSATMPTLLIDAKYSRDFEREADDAAVAYLKWKGLPVRTYADILGRLAADHRKGEKGEKKGSRFGELFEDHPLTEERVKRVLSAG